MSVSYGTRSFNELITGLASIYSRYTTILSYLLRLGLTIGFTCCNFENTPTSSILATFPVHLNLLDFIILIILGPRHGASPGLRMGE